MIKNWLRKWLGIESLNLRISKAEIAIKSLQEPASIELPDLMLHEIKQAQQPLKISFAELEKSFLEMNKSFAEETREIRAQLETPKRTKANNRPWPQLRAIAEAGELKAKGLITKEQNGA